MIYYYRLCFEDWIGFCIYKATDYFVGQRNIAFGASKLYRSKKNRIAK